MTHDCGHVVYVFRTQLIVMSHGFRACDPVRAHDLFYEFLIGYEIRAQLTRTSQLMDFTL